MPVGGLAALGVPVLSGRLEELDELGRQLGGEVVATACG
jgi:hypothetical protein